MCKTAEKKIGSSELEKIGRDFRKKSPSKIKEREREREREGEKRKETFLLITDMSKVFFHFKPCAKKKKKKKTAL